MTLLLYGKPIKICNSLNLRSVLPFSTVIFCLSYVPHDVERCRILPDYAEYGKVQSNSVDVPIASVISFLESDVLISLKTELPERL